MFKAYTAPKYVEYKGVRYKVYNSWLNILHTIKLLDEVDSGDEWQDEIDRAIILVQKIFGQDAPTEQKLVDKALEILNNGEDIKNQDKQLIGILEDYTTYRADFKSVFGIEIKDNHDLKWEDFINDLGYLSNQENTGIYLKAKIRNTNPNDIDKKYRTKFAEYQKSISLEKKKEVPEDYWSKQIAKAKGKLGGV